MAYPAGFLVLLCGLLVVAAACDLLRRKIPNALTASVLATGLLAQVLARGWVAGLSGLAACLIVAAVLWMPWLKGRVGGGDVKLAAGAAAWAGLPLLPAYALAAAVAGGVVAGLCYLRSSPVVRREVKANLSDAAVSGVVPDVPITRQSGGRVSVPYGVAVAIGAVVALFAARPQ